MAVDMVHYPYNKVAAANTMKGAELILRKLVNYFLYMYNNASLPDDNSNPRCRLLKYLFNDDADLRPLSGPLPTVEQRVRAVFDPTSPVTDGKREPYRIFPQMYTAQAQLTARTILRIYMGYMRPVSPLTASQAIIFEVMTNVDYDQLDEEAMSRTYSMLQCIIEALNGVNIGGVGGVMFSTGLRTASEAYPIGDRGTNVGYRLEISVHYTGEGTDDVCPV